MVRAPEVDPETRRFEESRLPSGEGLRVDFNVKSTELAIDLLHALQRKELVAIQGDRVTPGIASFQAALFGRSIALPAGPFALAMAARVPIFPLFIVRRGRRRYRLLACRPIRIERTSRKRDDDLRRAIDAWTSELEPVIRKAWYQWFAFEPFSTELA
jgi:predicted LPLAT superfamily acyltransferase